MQNSVESLQISISPEKIIEAVKKMEKEKRDAFIEDLLSVTSPEYLESIKEARKDYKEGRVYTHDEVFE